MPPSRANLDDLASLHSFVTGVHRHQHPRQNLSIFQGLLANWISTAEHVWEELEYIVLWFSFPLLVGGHTLQRS